MQGALLLVGEHVINEVAWDSQVLISLNRRNKIIDFCKEMDRLRCAKVVCMTASYSLMHEAYM